MFIMINTKDFNWGNNCLKYLPDNLKKEYCRIVANCSPINGLNHPLITNEDVLRAYFILADYFTDDSAGNQKEHMLIGLRSIDLLDSALCRQIVSFEGKKKYTNPLEICATLFYGLVKNHAFLDGNKRVSLLVLLYQLYLFGYVPNVSEKQFEKLVVSVAANKIDYRVLKKFKSDKEVYAIAYLLKRMTRKKDNSYHIDVTAKEFCDALSKVNVDVELDNGKLKFHIEIKKKFPFKSKSVSFSIVFGGWSRVIGAKTAREILKSLELYNQYPTYQDFVNGSDPLYQMVQQFEAPLRRLKDE